MKVMLSLPSLSNLGGDNSLYFAVHREHLGRRQGSGGSPRVEMPCVPGRPRAATSVRTARAGEIRRASVATPGDRREGRGGRAVCACGGSSRAVGRAGVSASRAPAALEVTLFLSIYLWGEV